MLNKEPWSVHCDTHIFTTFDLLSVFFLTNFEVFTSRQLAYYVIKKKALCLRIVVKLPAHWQEKRDKQKVILLRAFLGVQKVTQY